MDYNRGSHSKYSLMVHLIFVCKYRKKLLIRYGEEIKNIFIEIANNNNCKIIEMEEDKDHIHMLLSYNPTQSITKLATKFKSISTYRIWRQNNNHLHLKSEFWKENTFWSDGYFACSIGQVSKEIIEKYINK